MTARIGVLGPVRLADRDAGGVPMRALLVALVLAGRGSASSVAALAEAIWGDEPPQNPRAALQTLVSRVRAHAGADVILSVPGGYALGTDDTDLARVRAAVAGEEEPSERIRRLREAAALWRGEPGADLGTVPVAEEIARVAHRLRAELDRRLAQALIQDGRPGEAVFVLEELSGLLPLDDAAQGALMDALAADGRPGEALEVFSRFRTVLREELGASPGAELTARNASLLRAQDQGPRVRIGVQAAPNELIGRDDALREIPRLLTTSRVVTILGAGGLGKTRLAQAIATSSAAPAVAVVPLAGVRVDADVPAAIAAALGISEASSDGRLTDPRARPDLRARVVALRAERPTLLVLDNCEQVIEAAAHWAADVLRAVPELRILATSRTPLAISGEAVYPLDALSVEDSGADHGPAVRLFLERAVAARPGARLPIDVVRRLCTHLDGLPLGIELAAARVRTMSPAQIEERLTDRFTLLRSGDRAAPERHRTLEAVIGWSWDLLDDDARHAMARLSVLPAGFSATTAAAVLHQPDADDVLDRLASQSLLVVAEPSWGGEVRFRMLETVREFALARLAGPGFEGEEAAWEAVLDWASTFASGSGSVLLDDEAYRRIRGEHDNLIAVLRRAIGAADDVRTVLAFSLLCQSWMVRGSFTELMGFGEAAFAAVIRARESDIAPDARALVLLMGSFIGLFSGEIWSLRLLAHLRVLRRRHPVLQPVQGALADLLCAAPDPARMRAVLDDLAEDADPVTALVGTSMRAQSAENEGDVELAMRSGRRAWELSQQQGAGWIGAMAAMSNAQLASQSARPEEAMLWLDRANERLVAFGSEEQARQQQWILGGNLISLGRHDQARKLFHTLCASHEVTEDGLELASIGWIGLAELARIDGDGEQAAELYERALVGFRNAQQRSSPWYLMAMSTLLAATATDETLPAPRSANWARRLRTRWLAVRRLRPGYVDRPVLGCVLTGWAAWALRQERERETGVRLLALAEGLAARQDLPSLHLRPLFAAAERLVGVEAVEAARSASASLTREARVELATALLRTRR